MLVVLIKPRHQIILHLLLPFCSCLVFDFLATKHGHLIVLPSTLTACLSTPLLLVARWKPYRFNWHNNLEQCLNACVGAVVFAAALFRDRAQSHTINTALTVLLIAVLVAAVAAAAAVLVLEICRSLLAERGSESKKAFEASTRGSLYLREEAGVVNEELTLVEPPENPVFVTSVAKAPSVLRSESSSDS